MTPELLARVPAALRAGAAYHVPQPPQVRAKLDANELPHALPGELRARLGAALAEVALERYPDPTARELRARVAAQLGVAGDRLTFGNGSDELIAMIASAFATGPVLFPSPSFVYYRLAATARGLDAIEVPLRRDFTLDEAALDAAIARHQPGCVFLALPNNPTGTLWRVDLAPELAARYPGVAIVSDEAYVAYSRRTNLPHAQRNLIVLRTLSKIGLAGLRVGFAISSPEIAALLDKLRPPYNLSALDQRAAAFAIDEAASWCDARAAEVVAERARLAAVLAASPLRLEVIPSEANFVLVRTPRAREIYQHLFDAGVVVRAFGHSELADCLRITVGSAAENRLLEHTLAAVRVS
nr:aminotransferase class I/II-fold pyridoxal phosphate-dependent enzyme [Kofleriaceae bacterium]